MSKILSNLLENGRKCIEKCNFYIKCFDKIKCYADRPYLVFSELKPETHVYYFGLSIGKSDEDRIKSKGAIYRTTLSPFKFMGKIFCAQGRVTPKQKKVLSSLIVNSSDILSLSLLPARLAKMIRSKTKALSSGPHVSHFKLMGHFGCNGNQR